MTDEQETNHAFARSRSNAGLGDAPSIEAAYAMGAKGGPVVEAERLAFEAWMRGHCWSVSDTWDGSQYADRKSANKCGGVDPLAMDTRRLWAVWRDRAALTPNATVRRPPLKRTALRAAVRT